jgi:hypothetical protein
MGFYGLTADEHDEMPFATQRVYVRLMRRAQG